MITAKDVRRKKFEKVKFGYSPEEVDAFLSQLANDLQLLEQESADSSEKIQLLADKVREYKDTEEDLRNALIGAQKQAREVIDAAKAKAEQIEAEARENVGTVQQKALADQEAQLAEISAKLAQENDALVDAQKQVAAFKQSLFDLYREHLAQISKLPENTDGVQRKPAEPEQKAEEKAEEKPAESEPVKAEEAPAPAEETPKAEEPVKEELAKAEEPAPAEEKPAEVKQEAEAVTADPFAADNSRKQSFGSRRDGKRRR